MNGFQTILHKEIEWQNSMQSGGVNDTGDVPLLTVCGPSGAGKSTIVAALATAYPVFIETIEGNPHLKDLLEGNTNFKAAANQEWFLNRVSEHITRVNPRSHLVLDQDPAGIVLAYSRMFLEDEKMTEIQYTLLLQKLLEIEDK